MKTNKTKPAIQDIFQEFGPEYLERYGERMPKEHRKVYDAIVSCRSGEHGIVVYECGKCGGPLLFLSSEIPTAKGWKRIYPPLKPPLLTG